MPTRRRRVDDDDSPEPTTSGPATQRRRTNGEVSDYEEDADEEIGGAINNATQADGLDDMVKKLVRLALACEYQRRPIRRIEINEKVLGSHPRQFRSVFAQAQIQLNGVFGMTMVELPVKERVTLQQRRAAQKAPVQPKPTTSWILTTVLPSEYRNPETLQPPSAPTIADESIYTGIYTLLVCLISLSGGSVPEAKMDRYLRRLQMEDRTPLASYDRTEKLLKRMEKDGYITKVKESSGAGEDDVYWIVGPRGKVEIGDDGVRGLARTVFGTADNEAEEEELERRIARSLGMNDRSDTRQAPAASEPRPRGRPRRNENGEVRRDNMDDSDGDED